jgi:ABC-2 type transport system permease protein
MLRLEWRLLLRTKAPWLVAGLIVLASATAILDRSSVQMAARSQYVLASLPAAILSNGDTAILPQRFEARSGERFSPFYRTSRTHILGAFFPETPAGNPASSLAGTFDLAFVATYLYPLLILALTCNIANADRESGVLALIQAQPISRARWLSARALVRAAFLFGVGVLLPALAVSAMVAGSWVRLATWMLALTAYSTFWFVVAVVISLRTSSPAPGFVIGIATWLTLVILVPALVNLAAPLLAPSAATISYVNAERAASLEINPRIDAATTAVIRYGAVPHELLSNLVEQQPRWQGGLSRPQLQRALVDVRRLMFERRLAPILGQLDSDEQRLGRAISLLRFCSPALLFESVVDDLAGTGRARWNAFMAQVDAHVRMCDEQMTVAILAGQPSPPALPFTYREESTAELLHRLAARLAALLLLPWITVAAGRWQRHPYRPLALSSHS